MNGVSHPGEVSARSRFGTAARWPEARLSRFYRQSIDDETALWIESLPFFFIATADAGGHCDCSFRGRETGPLLQLFNSLGNMLVNPHIGLLFIDFAAQARMRVNGEATLIELDGTLKNQWPRAQRGVRVRVAQVYGNCRQRIPRMTLDAPSQEWGT